MKSGSKELPSLWSIGQYMFTKNYAEIYRAFGAFAWSDEHKPLVAALAGIQLLTHSLRYSILLFEDNIIHT